MVSKAEVLCARNGFGSLRDGAALLQAMSNVGRFPLLHTLYASDKAGCSSFPKHTWHQSVEESAWVSETTSSGFEYRLYLLLDRRSWARNLTSELQFLIYILGDNDTYF